MHSLIALAVCALALLVGAAIVGISARRGGRDLKRALAEGEQLRGTVAALQAEVAELKQAAADRARAPREFVPAPAMTAEQRAGSLEMLRSGADPAAVSAAMGLSQAEVDLLQKIQIPGESKAKTRDT